jgi:hypothetical protein
MRIALGILAVLLVVVVVAAAAADARFQRDTDEAARALLEASGSTAPEKPITAADLDPLPPPVRRWLAKSGVVGKPIPRVVRLKQRGDLRTAPEQKYMQADAEQYFRTDAPAFVWRVRTRMNGLPIAGRDSYRDGRGRMLITIAGLVHVVDAADDKIDHGTLLRYLGEMTWFPAAALRPYVRWEPIDDRSARSIMSWGGVEAAAIWQFDEQDRAVGLEAERYLGGGDEAKLERWVVRATAFREMDGVIIPVEGEVTWRLAGGDFTYYRWQIPELQYDRRELYGGVQK